MSTTKKLVYSAAMTAVAVVAIAVARFFPRLSLTPLMFCSMCFYVSSECGWRYGFLTIAATLVLGFFIAGLSGVFLLCALIFAPYSILARIIKRYEYNSVKSSLIRIGSVVLAFNALFAIIVFALGGFIDELIFSYTLSELLSSFNNAGYIVVAMLGTIAMVGFDFIFAGISKIIIQKYLKLGAGAPTSTDVGADINTDAWTSAGIADVNNAPNANTNASTTVNSSINADVKANEDNVSAANVSETGKNACISSINTSNGDENTNTDVNANTDTKK